MSTFGVYVHQLTIHPHDNADLLELAQVGGYRAVVKKGEFVTGDYAFYIPEQAIVPNDILEDIGLVGKLAGKDHNRVKAMRLRGQLSQGIVYRPTNPEIIASAVSEIGEIEDVVRFRESYAENPNKMLEFLHGAKSIASPHPEYLRDYSTALMIHKWVPPVPVHFGGDVESCAWLKPMFEVDDIKAQMELFEPGQMVVASEKLHGTCTIMGYHFDEDRFVVSSKGLASQRLALKESETNLYWRMAHAYGVLETMKEFADCDLETIHFYGETFGPNIQDLTYAQTDPTYRIFGCHLKFKNGTEEWLSPERIQAMIAINPKLEMVPHVYAGPYDYDRLVELSQCRSVTFDPGQIAEGIVVSAWTHEPGHYGVIDRDNFGHKRIAKFVNPDYLVREGGTEYE